MARIRYLKPDFFKDEDLAEHPHWIRLLFQGLWTIADKEGRLEDRPKRIKADLFPYENTDIDKGLTELSKIKNHSSRPFIQRYEVDGEKYIAIVNWHKHQKPHHTEKESVIPPCTPMGMEKGMENQHEASAGLNNSVLTVKEPKKDISLSIYEHYSKTIKPGAKEDAVKSINRLLTKEGFTRESLLGRIDAYKAQLTKEHKDDKTYYIQANNFFGRQARFKDFEPIKVVEYLPPNKDCKACKGQGRLQDGEGKLVRCSCVKEKK